VVGSLEGGFGDKVQKKKKKKKKKKKETSEK